MTSAYVEIALAPLRAEEPGLAVAGQVDILDYPPKSTAGSLRVSWIESQPFLVWQLDGERRRLSLDLIGPDGRLASADVQFSATVLGAIPGQCIGSNLVVAVATGDAQLHIISVPRRAVGDGYPQATGLGLNLVSTSLKDRLKSVGTPTSMAFVGTRLCVGTDQGRLLVVTNVEDPASSILEMHAQTLGLHKVQRARAVDTRMHTLSSGAAHQT